MSQENTATPESTVTESKPKKEKAPKEPKAPRVKKEKPARLTPAHMSKVDKVANLLPQLSTDASVLFTAANNMASADICALVAHLNIAIRKRGIVSSASSTSGKLSVGDQVRIRSSQTNPRFIGMTGTVAKVQRIRCYVRLEGRDKDDYFFITDCEQVGSPSALAADLTEVVQHLSTPAPTLDLNTIEDEPETTEESAVATG